ncbi:ADR132Wp [Eremothecium gossypii ATCC 10895]|uniref:ADR132Wp n=1 Tax=Eremothecium gossypii (strain ATCC 10895 / CBS 109.51 / FGSC 9923 / NRRL Y-1056) TaxID=284811 RepID=Q759Z1_EREGS|nr:ADR132Wp [Eremothecium gossypii ATCC 10895]AAS52052.1 ADR132Wp [Eremothecium gossypii ATCC 10895]AEY96351.1 FADR132Wp [Eremothecium gossypii FDAG1]
MKGLLSSVVLLAAAWTHVSAEEHVFHWKTGMGKANPDTLKERPVITCNGEYPWPAVRVKQGDKVSVLLENGFEKWNTSLHFHGMFQNGTNQMDGPEMVTQCPIPPGGSMWYNFTVEGNKGTFWYHSHTAGQFQDGMKGVFVIDEANSTFAYNFDKEMTLELSEWYHDVAVDKIPEFLHLYNPTGAEPIPQNLIINNTRNLTWKVEPDTTYLLRLVNTGGFVSQYFWIEDHEMEVVEVDGVYVEKNVTNMLYITSAQRYSVLVHTKNETSRNFAIMQKMDDTMLDVMPDDLQLNATSYMIYNDQLPNPEEHRVGELEFLDDIYLVPIDEHRVPMLEDATAKIEVTVDMDNLMDGRNYAFFNNITYTEPKVPTLMTVLSAGDKATNPLVYGTNTNAHVLEHNDIVEIVINNKDTGRHPFHLHGHVFQVVARGPTAADQDDLDAADPIEYPGEDEGREYPMTRDTVYVNGKSYVVLRFKADNPGVWFFHCHLEWHMIQGLSLTIIEAPLEIQRTASQKLTDSTIGACQAAHVPHIGNAAAHTEDLLDLSGQNVQQKSIPEGFTPKGIVAMFFSCLAAVLGLITIAVYGLMDMKDAEGRVIEDLGVDPVVLSKGSLADEGSVSTSSDVKK